MANKEYTERLQRVIRRLHKCDSVHIESVPVKEVFREETVWEGVVEVYCVTHPKATRCYAWSENPGQPDERLTAVLGIPPVRTPLDAVKVSIVAHAHKHSE